jgi:hypothetical protein
MFPFVRQERPLKRNWAVVLHKTMPPHCGREHFKPHTERLAAMKIVDKPTVARHPLHPPDKANNLIVGQRCVNRELMTTSIGPISGSREYASPAIHSIRLSTD